MELSEKLISLFNKAIDKTTSMNDIISDRGFGCNFTEGDSKYVIKTTYEAKSITHSQPIVSVPFILFQELKCEITMEEYSNIVEKVKEKIRYFTIEDEKRKIKQAEIIVDRLLDKL